MTEAFPNVGHYRNLLSATADPNLKPRPTLEELHGDKVTCNSNCEMESRLDHGYTKKG